MLAKLDNCITISRTLKKFDPSQMPSDVIGACCHHDAAQQPLSTPGKPHDTCQQRADAARGHPYNEFHNVVNDADKSARVKYFADVDRALCPFHLQFYASPFVFCFHHSTVMSFPRMMADTISLTGLFFFLSCSVARCA